MAELGGKEARRTKPVECSACLACADDPEINKLIHDTKFEEVLTLAEVSKRLWEGFGVSISKKGLSLHYQKHTTQELKDEYEMQAHAAQAIHEQRRKGKIVQRYEVVNLLNSTEVDFLLSFRILLWRHCNNLAKYKREHPLPDLEQVEIIKGTEWLRDKTRAIVVEKTNYYKSLPDYKLVLKREAKAMARAAKIGKALYGSVGDAKSPKSA